VAATFTARFSASFVESASQNARMASSTGDAGGADAGAVRTSKFADETSSSAPAARIVRMTVYLMGMLRVRAAVIVGLAALTAASATSAQPLPTLGPLDASGRVTYFIEDGEPGSTYTPADRDLARWALEAWARASALAATQVGAGRYSAADRLLADFAAQYQSTPQALVATLRRAVYMADPANETASARAATTLLDSTLTMPLDSAGRAEARVIRRITMALEHAAALASNSGGSSASSPDSSPRPDDTRSSSDEVQRLRNELAKANAELERIKKRVAQPKP